MHYFTSQRANSDMCVPIGVVFFLANGNDLSGAIPTQLDMNMNLQAISLQSNKISSTIPTVLGSLNMLQTVNLFNNELQGPIPTQLGMLTNLENLFLHFNALTGTMPAQICALRSLGLRQLTADCGPRGRVVCMQPLCCTLCF
jgi:hypothetical protein